MAFGDSGPSSKPEPVAGVDKASVQINGCLVKHEPVTRVHFNSDSLTVPSVLRVSWSQVALADIEVRSKGRRIELVICSADHRVFDFITLVMPMNPASAGLLEVLQAKDNIKLESIPHLLLLWPFSWFYSNGFALTTSIRCYNIVSTTFEVLFGFMFLTGFNKMLRSRGRGISAQLTELGKNIAELFRATDVDPVDALYPYLEWFFPVAPEAAALVVRHLMKVYWPLQVAGLVAWHVSDFASEGLLLLLLAFHLLSTASVIYRTASTLRTAIKIIGRIVGLLVHGATRCFYKASAEDKAKKVKAA